LATIVAAAVARPLATPVRTVFTRASPLLFSSLRTRRMLAAPAPHNPTTAPILPIST